MYALQGRQPEAQLHVCSTLEKPRTQEGHENRIYPKQEAIASRLEAIALRLEAIASRWEAIALRLEAIAFS